MKSKTKNFKDYKPRITTDDLMEQLEKGVEGILSSEKRKEYLLFQSKFHTYSFGNTLSILMQMPNASHVAGFDTWKKQFNRHVKKGEKGIAILAPVIVKEEKENAEGKIEKKSKLACFKVTYVYDISQTEGDPLPDFQFAKRLEGESDLYARVLSICPFPVQKLEDCGGANGYYSLTDQSIAILSSLSKAHKGRCLVHEIAHGLLHDPKTQNEEDGEETVRPDCAVRELEAESISFLVASHFGLDSSDYAFGYIAGWAGNRAIKEIKKSGARIQKTAEKIIESIESTFEEEVEDTNEMQSAV
jgi:antirestriction protein ArdC